MSKSPQFIGLLGQREIVLIQKILHENDATEEEMKKLFEEERMRKQLTAALQEVRAEILVQRGETVMSSRKAVNRGSRAQISWKVGEDADRS